MKDKIVQSPWFFRVVDVLIGPVVLIVTELQRQVDEAGVIDTRLLISVGLAALLQILWHLQRMMVETAQAKGEVATGVDQDADDRVEHPE